MKHILSTFILIIGLYGVVEAQTHEIAHKSHSGGPSVDRCTPERFGEMMSPPLTRIERILNETDTATILYYGSAVGGGGEQYRVDNHPVFNAPDLDFDSLRAAYPEHIEFVGFDGQSPVVNGLVPEVNSTIKTENETKSCKRKKDKQWLLPFSIKTGTGTLILLLMGFLLFFRTKNTEQVHLASH